MRKTFLTAALAAALLCTTSPLLAATPGEFYSSLLRRGVAAFDAARYEEASRHLRYAAFGYVDSIEQYQTAQVYLALTHERLEEQDRAREAVQRVIQAERIERRYARIPIPAAVRTAFEKVAVRVLTAAELAALRGTGELPPAPPVQTTLRTTTTGTVTGTVSQPVQPPPARPAPVTTATTTTQPPVTVDRIDVEVVKPQPQQTQPQRATQQPAASTQPNTTQATPPRPQQTQPQVSSTQPARTPAVTTPRGTNNTPSTSTSTASPRPATPAPARPSYSASELATRFANAERALTTANLAEARRIYRELLASASSADHDTAVRIAEGFYRARDFAGALAAFERAGTLRRGEEPYRYYVAVALYETGQYERAKRELAAAVPYIEVTPDVERYRLKIQSAIQ